MSITAYTVPGQTTELQDLIQGCIRNDRAAQEKVYHLFYPRMMGVVRRYIDQQGQAEEVTEQWFLRAFQKVSQYTFQGSFEGWLRKIVFRSIRLCKAKRPVQRAYCISEGRIYIQKDHADKFILQSIVELVQSLPVATRSVFNMYVMEGFAHKEIGKLLGISEQSLRS